MPYQQEKEASASRWTWTVVLGTLVAGAVASLAAKTLYQIKVSDSCQGSFQKPFFLTCAMFIGEMMCLGYYQLFVSPKTSFAARRHRRAQASLLDAPVAGGALIDEVDDIEPAAYGVSDDESQVAPVDLPSVPVWFFLILCTFDLTASTLNFVGLLWITASLNLMFRGSMAVFVALFSVCLLRRRLQVVQWVSVAIVVAGLGTVGFSSYLKPKNPDEDETEVSSGEIVIGVMLTLASAVLNSFQNVVEELLMKMLSNYAEPHPLEIVGWEGVFGTLLSGFVMLPAVHYIGGSDCGRQEDAIDTLKQFHDPLVCMLVLAYVFGLALMNYFSMELSRLLSAVVRNLVSGVRTVLVWIISVILYYAVGKSYGEQIGLWSIVELCGFVLLIGGSVLYSKAKETQLPSKAEQGLINEQIAVAADNNDDDESDYQRMDDSGKQAYRR